MLSALQKHLPCAAAAKQRMEILTSGGCIYIINMFRIWTKTLESDHKGGSRVEYRKPGAGKQNGGSWPENRLLLTMAIPIVISMLVQALYNVVDSVLWHS